MSSTPMWRSDDNKEDDKKECKIKEDKKD